MLYQLGYRLSNTYAQLGLNLALDYLSSTGQSDSGVLSRRRHFSSMFLLLCYSESYYDRQNYLSKYTLNSY
jgi:hypothetical protein